MKKTIFLTICCLLLIWTTTSQGASKEELQVFVEKSAAHCLSVGKEQCLKDFTENTDGQWVDGELYVFAFDYNGVCIAHGANKKLIGKNLIKLKDVKGQKFIIAMLEAAKKGEGWVNYYWNHPQKKKVKPKMVYVKKVDDTFWVAAGVYK